MEHKCPADGCEFETDSNRGLSIHFTQSHPDKEYDFTNKSEFTCPQCETKFRDYESRRSAKNEKRNFCSRECKRCFEGSDGIDVNCAECSTETHIPPSHIDSVNGYEQRNHFCSKDCESKFKKREWQGEDHPSYNGGTLVRMGPNWTNKRSEALSRDNHTCQDCGISEESHKEKYKQSLHVHHKIPRKEILSNDPTEKEFELVNNLSNLVTVCASCHRKRESNFKN